MATPAPAPVLAPVPTPTPVSTPAPDPTPTIRSSLYTVLVELAGSAKFQVLVASIIAWIALKLGWHVDQAQIDRLLALVGSYLLAQGVADHGVSRAKVEAATQIRLATMSHAAHSNLGSVAADILRLTAANTNTNANRGTPERDPKAGVVQIKMMAFLSVVTLALGIAGATLCSGCATITKMTGAFATCEKADLGAVLSSVPTDLATDLATAGTTPSAGVLANCAALMSANVPGLEADLTTIAIQIGEGAFECVWTTIEAVLGTSADPATKAGLARARVLVAKRRAASAAK